MSCGERTRKCATECKTRVKRETDDAEQKTVECATRVGELIRWYKLTATERGWRTFLEEYVETSIAAATAAPCRTEGKKKKKKKQKK